MSPTDPKTSLFRAGMISSEKLRLLQVALILMAGFWVFVPALHGDWLWDDQLLTTFNPVVQDPHGLWKIWFQPSCLIDYFPLKVTVQWVQWHLWGNHTFPYHLTNLVLHLLGALLVWKLLAKFKLRFAWLGGLIFAIHPVVVESVAWIAELKNTLSLPPFLLAMCAWLDYEERGRRRDFLLSLALFVVSMLCKTSMALFPFIMLLYCWWKRGCLSRRDLFNASPFFLVSLVLGLVTIVFQQRHIVQLGGSSAPLHGVLAHFACAGWIVAFYFSKAFLPVHLLTLYPQWSIDPSSLLDFFPSLIVIGIVLGLAFSPALWCRDILLGFGFFLINLAPFLAFIPASYFRLSWVMDHTLYLPLIGLIGLVVAGLEGIDRQMSLGGRTLLYASTSLILVYLAGASHAYAGRYINDKTLWTRTLAENPEAWMGHNCLGGDLLDEGRIPEAILEYRETLRLRPDFYAAHDNLGNALEQTGHLPEALAEYQEAVKENPYDADSRDDLARLQAKSKIDPGALRKTSSGS